MEHEIITLTEWAALVGMDISQARRNARDNRLPGAYRSAGVWLLPRATQRTEALPAGRPWHRVPGDG